ncbi:hypothetical protein DSUL_60261 [Desulfovibrionales bacterium]
MPDKMIESNATLKLTRITLCPLPSLLLPLMDYVQPKISAFEDIAGLIHRRN